MANTVTTLALTPVVDTSGATVTVAGTAVCPGWYAGRITHIHAQVYLNDSLVSGTAIATTQLAFPIDITTAVYDSSLYTKGQNTSVTSFSSDNVFSDGTSTEMLSDPHFERLVDEFHIHGDALVASDIAASIATRLPASWMHRIRPGVRPDTKSLHS